MKYRIDDLGWFSFERLLQSLLKATIGIGVETWSGHSDLGRDAYCPADLPFPVRDVTSEGPFVFQVKFVSGANAAGSEPYKPLCKAVKAEIKAIEKRVSQGQWRNPGSYVLLTNVPLTQIQRTEIQELLGDVLEGTEVLTLGAKDICDLLDNSPAIRQAYPEILGLGDLQALIKEAVNSAVRERSASTILEAEDLSQVFVATRAYYTTLDLLAKHHFVVLDGPPEMGKTAIARMVALAGILNQWTALECRGPDDFFAAYDISGRQIFIADDALGRTEFDITLSRQWERDLPRILRRTGANHWLVWTTRKHILARALATMDLTGRAKGFPDPAEVVVDAADLTVEEKARILYRHAKTWCSTDTGISLVRQHAKRIVKSKFFTPERIRRFVQERLPELVDMLEGGALDSAKLDAAIDEAIQSPTDRMRLAFAALPPTHRYLLMDMLECGAFCRRKDLLDVHEKRHGSITSAAFEQAVDDLIGTFIRSRYKESVDWIHPSYRDVVIDEVSEDATLQVEFIRSADIEGLQLAFSTEGGAAGNRNMPFLRCRDSWAAAEQRLQALAHGAQLSQVLELIRSGIASTSGDPELQKQLHHFASVVLEGVRESVESGRELYYQEIEALYRLCSDAEVCSPSVFLSNLLRSRLTEIEEELDDEFEVDSGLVEELFSLVNWVQAFEPSTLSEAETTRKLDFVLDVIYKNAESETDRSVDEHGDYEEDIAECERLSAAFESLNYGDLEKASEMAHLLEIQRDYYLDYQIPEDVPDYDDDGWAGSPSGPFDIDALFSDL
ncbi:MAG TPA: hypothetical protein VMX15_02480 [Candidatus Heimdallarchaeota archaeon]|nr:hypothetical protein [Candidatus Heimdallarchaeota archaeon]